MLGASVRSSNYPPTSRKRSHTSLPMLNSSMISVLDCYSAKTGLAPEAPFLEVASGALGSTCSRDSFEKRSLWSILEQIRFSLSRACRLVCDFASPGRWKSCVCSSSSVIGSYGMSLGTTLQHFSPRIPTHSSKQHPHPLQDILP